MSCEKTKQSRTEVLDVTISTQSKHRHARNVQRFRTQFYYGLWRRYMHALVSDFRIAHDFSPLPSGSVARAIKNIDRVGGFTYNPRSNQLPSSGVAVALAGHSAIYTISTWHAGYDRGLVSYLKNVGSLLAANGRVELGGWFDREHQMVYLDLVEVFPDRVSAIAAGKERGELAVFDLSAQVEIRLVPGSVGGTRPPLAQYFVRNSHRRPRVTSACCWDPEPLRADEPHGFKPAPPLPQSIPAEQALLPSTRPAARRVSSAFTCDFPLPRKPVEH